MQILYLSSFWMIVMIFAGWIVFSLGAVAIGNHIPEKALNRSWLFLPRKFETDAFYKKTFKIHLWKRFLPDGGVLFKTGFSKKNLQTPEKLYLERFILESKRAELIHWLAILPFWLFGFIAPPLVIPFMLLYALTVNLPCIFTQRYNRPRLVRLLAHMESKEKNAKPGEVPPCQQPQ